MREETLALFAGKLRGHGRRGVLGEGAGFAQKFHRLTQPGVKRSEFGVGGDLRLQGRGFSGRKLAHEHGGEADLDFLARCERSVGIHSGGAAE